jgi:hypothetical protein
MGIVRHLSTKTIGVFTFAFIGASLFFGGQASAADPVYIGAGTKFTIPNADGHCSVAAVGKDKFNNKVALTAGHCGSVGTIMRVNGQDVGTFATSTGQGTGEPNKLDYAFVKLYNNAVARDDPASPVNVKKISAPSVLQWPVCKFGYGVVSSGERCGATYNIRENDFDTTIFMSPFDSGSPVYVNRTELIGIVSHLQVQPEVVPGGVMTRADAAVRDATVKNTVGAGFVPEA